MADARSDARVGEDRQALLKNTHVARSRGVSRLTRVVGAGHVAPGAHDVDEAVIGSHAQGRGQGGQVGEGRARAGHACVDLDVDARGAADLPGGGADVGEHPRPRHGQVDVGLDRGREVGGGGRDPREDRGLGSGDPGLVEAAAQCEGLGQLGDTQPVGATIQGGAGHREESVPVGVGLDGRELERARGGCAQDAQVVTDRGQVDGRG